MDSANILSVISSASTSEIDLLSSVPHSATQETHGEKRSVLKTSGGAGICQLSEEYVNDDRISQYQRMEQEVARNSACRRHSMMERKCYLTNEPETFNSSHAHTDRRKSMSAVMHHPLPDFKVSPPPIESASTLLSSCSSVAEEPDNKLFDEQAGSFLKSSISADDYQLSSDITCENDAKNSLSSVTNRDRTFLMPVCYRKDTSDECFQNENTKMRYSSLAVNKFSAPKPSALVNKNFNCYPHSIIRRKSCTLLTPPLSTGIESQSNDDLLSGKKPLIRRRSSVTFGTVEEVNEHLVKTLRIPSIEEGYDKDESDSGAANNSSDNPSPNNDGDDDDINERFVEEQEQLDYVEQIRTTKRRSKSLCSGNSSRFTVSKNLTFPASRRIDPCMTPHSSTSSDSKSASNEALLAAVVPEKYPNYNIRSDSVDSGFSCASLSSGSSSEPSTPTERRCRSASIAVGLGAAGFFPHNDPGDYPSWLRSIKKLVALTKELKNSLDIGSASASLDDSHQAEVENVKKFVRHNDWPVSHEIRADLWRILCYNKDFETNKFLYTQQLDDLTRSGVKTYRPSFLLMDGIVIHDHGLKEQGAVTLQKLLIVIECVRPEIRFVPILYPLCAMFLHYMSAEETFACVMRLLSQGHTYVLQSELAVYASCHTLLSLLKKHKKSVYSMLKRRVGAPDDTKLAEVFSQWNAWIFKYMPFEYLVRVIDCFLVEGHKMLLRVTLSLVYVWYKERSRTFALNNTAHNATNNNNNGSGGRFPLIRSSTMPSGRGGKLSMSGLGDATMVSSGKLSAVDQNIADVNEQIVAIAQNCPISVQTLLDMGCAIRNFKHSAFEQRQKHYENKFRDKVARIRSEKMNSRPFRSIYTAAFESKIIDTEAASELIAALPSRFQLETPEILFRLSEHGASFVQLWSQIDDAEQTLLIFRSTAGEVFGAYCSSCWSERRDVRERAKTRYFGTGESFVWLLHKELRLPVIYPWAGQNSDHPDTCPQMFMTAGDKYMIIGSGGEGDAIAIRDELTRGLSYPCDTFASPELITTGNAFEIDEMEVYMVFSTGGARD